MQRFCHMGVNRLLLLSLFFIRQPIIVCRDCQFFLVSTWFVCQPWALVMTYQSIAVVDATQCLVWWPCVSRGRGRVHCRSCIYIYISVLVCLYRYGKVLLHTKNCDVVGNSVVNCMLIHDNVHWAADHKKHSSRCCCNIHVSFSFTHAQSDCRALEDHAVKITQYPTVEGYVMFMYVTYFKRSGCSHSFW